MKVLNCLAIASLLFVVSNSSAEENRGKAKDNTSDVFTLVVMDPLAAPLSCPCVEGYAQRKYEALAAHLESQLGEKVHLVFNEALGKALQGEAKGRADLIIGKDSVVRADAKTSKLSLTAVARLTDKQGSVDQHGLIVVPAADPAKTVADLAGYDIIFGPAECDEKHQAAMTLLKKHGVDVPAKLMIDNACSEGAAKVVERGPKSKSAAVISSYAAPLLEGCGTIKKGDLRVVGKTEPVPFVTAFVNEELPVEQRLKIQLSLFSVIDDPKLCAALESLAGFLPATADAEPVKKN